MQSQLSWKGKENNRQNDTADSKRNLKFFFFWFLLYLVGILCVTQHSIDNILITYIANINIAPFQKVPL